MPSQQPLARSLQHQWETLCRRHGVPPPLIDSYWTIIEDGYSGNGIRSDKDAATATTAATRSSSSPSAPQWYAPPTPRGYHTLQHIDELLAQLKWVTEIVYGTSGSSSDSGSSSSTSSSSSTRCCESPDAIRFAIFFHDVVYETQAAPVPLSRVPRPELITNGDGATTRISSQATETEDHGDVSDVEPVMAEPYQHPMLFPSSSSSSSTSSPPPKISSEEASARLLEQFVRDCDGVVSRGRAGEQSSSSSSLSSLHQLAPRALRLIRATEAHMKEPITSAMRAVTLPPSGPDHPDQQQHSPFTPSEDTDLALFLDMDMAILGASGSTSTGGGSDSGDGSTSGSDYYYKQSPLAASPGRYESYADGVATEYAVMGPEAFHKGRLAVLKKFLEFAVVPYDKSDDEPTSSSASPPSGQQQPMFKTRLFYDVYNARVTRNAEWEIKMLEAKIAEDEKRENTKKASE